MFRRLWSEEQVHDRSASRKRFLHPRAGQLDIEVHLLVAPDTAEQSLVFHMPRDAATRAGFALLGRPRKTRPRRRP